MKIFFLLHFDFPSKLGAKSLLNARDSFNKMDLPYSYVSKRSWWNGSEHIPWLDCSNLGLHCLPRPVSVPIVRIITAFTMLATIFTGETVVPQKKKTYGLKIYHRFHFSSALKRMSVIAGHTMPGSMETLYIGTVKGAPETLKPMVC